MGFLDWLRRTPEKPIMTVSLGDAARKPAEPTINLKEVEEKIAELNAKNAAPALGKDATFMGYKVSGCWIRKEIIWNTIQEREQQKQLLDLHPYTIVSIKDWADQYIKVYGQDEFDKLKASGPRNWNMVASAKYQNFVVGGWYVEPEKYVEPPLKPGWEWYDTPFGRKQRPVPPTVTTTSAPTPVITTGIDVEKIKTDVEQAAFKGAYDGTTAALEAWKTQAQKDALS